MPIYEMKTNHVSKFVPTLALMFTFFLLSPYTVSAAERIESAKAAFHVGETLMVCGTVSQVTKLKKRTVLNLGRNYPNEDMYFLVWDSDVSGFENRFGNLHNLQGKRMCGTGTLEMYKGHIQMPLSNPMTLRLMQ